MAKFQKGQPRPPSSGRKPGTKNKHRLSTVRETLQERGINPILEILKLLPDLKVTEQNETWKWMQQYLDVKMTEDLFLKLQQEEEDVN
jgi:hypothetical protein